MDQAWGIEADFGRERRLESLARGAGACVVVVNGFLSQDLAAPGAEWAGALNRAFPGRPWSLLHWESQRTREFLARLARPEAGRLLERGLAALAQNKGRIDLGGTKDFLKNFAGETGLEELWGAARENADSAGADLAGRILDEPAHRKFVLVGHSLGARVVVRAMERLRREGERRLEGAHLLAGAVSVGAVDWPQAAAATSGGLFNYHTGRDMVLTLGYNLLMDQGPAVGTRAIAAGHPKVLDVDVGQWVENHAAAKSRAGEFLRAGLT